MQPLHPSQGRIGVCLVLLAAACSASNANGPIDLVHAPIDSSRTALVPGSEHPLASPNADVGAADGAMPMTALFVSLQQTPEQKAALDQLLADQQNPESPLFRAWITPDEFGARFGRSEHDLNAVEGWLASEGFTILRVSHSRTRVFFSGTAAQVAHAFGTEIHHYATRGGIHFANSSAVSLPTALAPAIGYVGGLNDFLPHSGAHGGPRASPGYSTGNVHYHYLVPQDIATIYDALPLASASPALDGSGVSIAVIGASAVTASDVSTWRSLSGLAAPNLSTYLVPNSGSSTYVNNGDNAETYLDIEWSGALAPAATINYVYTGGASGYGAFDALEYALDNPADVGNPTVVSASYKGCESGNGKSYSNEMRGWVKQAATEGITVLACAGDSGAAGCDPQDDSSDTQAEYGLAVEIPSSIPEVVAAGGTEFDEGSSPRTYWRASNNADYASAIGYIPETAWNDTGVSGDVGLASGGGGASIYFTVPSWQSPTIANGYRAVPDIALSASWDHDGYLLCLPDVTSSPTRQYCVNGFEAKNGYIWVYGGTSAVTPVFAGMVAVLNQALGTGLGNINPTLYALSASEPSIFHDIMLGNNIVPCEAGSTDCGCPVGIPGCSNSDPDQYGYSAGTGYDLATGLGSTDMEALWKYWPTKTKTTLKAAKKKVRLLTAVELTATIDTTRNGPEMGGTVTFFNDGTEIGTATVSSTGTAPAGAAATFLWTPSSGSSAKITASYGGDPTYLKSNSGSVTLTLESSE